MDKESIVSIGKPGTVEQNSGQRPQRLITTSITGKKWQNLEAEQFQKSAQFIWEAPGIYGPHSTSMSQPSTQHCLKPMLYTSLSIVLRRARGQLRPPLWRVWDGNAECFPCVLILQAYRREELWRNGFLPGGFRRYLSAVESPPKQCQQELWNRGYTHRVRVSQARTAGVSQDRTARSQHVAPVGKPQAWHFKLQKLKDRPGSSDLGEWGCWRIFGISPQLSILRRQSMESKVILKFHYQIIFILGKNHIFPISLCR